ncbi:hypothetical protein H696_02409 [Fonticula alba]|uniref:Succinate dehydrogenase [ubiquinone] cytochrome b small subunit n=1 Tax=Fonticula alba TaxID=691883 RepID=A0A058ZC16_FONAL|nr:hypothetical protein H696_02409 [Fonticula alba]KCV71463.1 hypothetical protein H696_02409 [Fonticula alba]|eukprot:XP_009494586.1 hypothetical protein H696_02409 [Fonticula alba]
MFALRPFINRQAVQQTAAAGALARRSMSTGSAHTAWTVDRLSAVGIALMIPGYFVLPSAAVDSILAGLIPVHLYFGFGSCITDYIPKRSMPFLNRAAGVLSLAVCAATFVSMTHLNSRDIGVTATLRELWSVGGRPKETTYVQSS